MSSDIAFGFSRALNGAQIAARLTGNALVLRDVDLTIVGSADATKVLAFSLAGNTTGKTLTLAPNQTTNQTLNIPNITATDTLATLGLAQTFTQAQTIDAGTGALPALANNSPLIIAGANSQTVDIGLVAFQSVGTFSAYRADGTRASKTAVAGNAQTFACAGWAWDGSAWGLPAAISMRALNAQSGTDHSGVIDFRATPAGSTTIATVARITQNLLIGTTTDITGTGGLCINSATLITTRTAFTNGAAAAAGTLTNAPAAGNPTKWIPINDNGTTRYIPAW